MGKGSSKGYILCEVKDNLKFMQLLSVIDVISEGLIEGSVDGLKSVLLNSMSVLDIEGNINIFGVMVVFRVGEQEQILSEGFEFFGFEMVLGMEVKYDMLIICIIMFVNIDCLCFIFGVQVLVEIILKGDRNLLEVCLLVQI